jgi:hypothetical protein
LHALIITEEINTLSFEADGAPMAKLQSFMSGEANYAPQSADFSELQDARPLYKARSFTNPATDMMTRVRSELPKDLYVPLAFCLITECFYHDFFPLLL